MGVLTGKPSARLDMLIKGQNMYARRVSIINTESSVVCSGSCAPALVDRLRRLPEKQRVGVRSESLAIPMPMHSRYLEPALVRFGAWLRLGHKSRALQMPVHSLSAVSRHSCQRPDRRWELIAAAQMTMEMDFPSTLESAMADNPTDIVDAGPQEVSIAAKLVRNAIQKCVRVNSLMRHRSSAEDLRITGPETHRVTPFIREDLSGESGSDSEESDESLSEPSTSIKFPASAASFTAKVLAQRLGSVPRQTATRKSPAREALQFGPHLSSGMDHTAIPLQAWAEQLGADPALGWLDPQRMRVYGIESMDPAPYSWGG